MTPETDAQRLPDWGKALAVSLASEVVGHPTVAFDSVTSTNDIAKDLALHGAPDGLAVVARSQTQGRGRRGRAWISLPDQAVYLSVLLRPPWKAQEATWLGVLGGIAAAEAVAEAGVPELLIKWPNDVLVRGRKIGGVLVEPRVGDDDLAFAVLGIGINVAQRPDEWPEELRAIATSCAGEGVRVERDRMIRLTLQRLDHWYRALLAGERQSLLDAWSRWSGSAQLPVLD